MNKKPTPSFQESRGRDNASRTSPSDPRLCVTVIATTEKGTMAALNAATCFAKDLDARIALLKTEVVPIEFPLGKSPISLDFATKQQCSLVLRSNAREEGVTIRTCLCRDREGCLRRVLRRRALVVIGGRRHWWLSREERMEKVLRGMGHHVIFIDLGDKTDPASHGSFPESLGSGARHIHKQANAADLVIEREDLR